MIYLEPWGYHSKCAEPLKTERCVVVVKLGLIGI